MTYDKSVNGNNHYISLSDILHDKPVEISVEMESNGVIVSISNSGYTIAVTLSYSEFSFLVQNLQDAARRSVYVANNLWVLPEELLEE